MKTSKYTRRFDPHHTMCEVQMYADRIKISFGKMYPSALGRIADSLEEMRICEFAIKDETSISLMRPDYGMFGDDEEFREIVSELFEEENYGITYIDSEFAMSDIITTLQEQWKRSLCSTL